jgi:hypothetical protein
MAAQPEGGDWLITANGAVMAYGAAAGTDRRPA